MKNKIDFNINNHVMVKLTDRGRQVMRENYERDVPARLLSTYPFKAKPVDADGFTRFQAWTLMYEFGNHMSNGGDLMFESTIKIEVDQ